MRGRIRSKAIDMTGVFHGSVRGIERVRTSSSGDLVWLFECGCGRHFETTGYSVRSGKVTSCKTCGAERTKKASIRHGATDSDEYRVWTNMLTRCRNPKSTPYKNYGARGIRVCDRWADSFDAFLSDMGKRPSKEHSIERDDNNGNYEPSNCRWITRAEQARNKRNSIRPVINGVERSLREWSEVSGISVCALDQRYRAGSRGEDLLSPTRGLIEFNGVTDSTSGWAKKLGMNYTTLFMRINKYKWPVERALTEGVRL